MKVPYDDTALETLLDQSLKFNYYRWGLVTPGPSVFLCRHF